MKEEKFYEMQNSKLNQSFPSCNPKEDVQADDGIKKRMQFLKFMEGELDE